MTEEQQANQTLQPTPYAPFVPHSATGAGELRRCAAAWMREAKPRVLWAWERQYSVARGAALSCGFQLADRSGATHRHNQALHPTARSVVVFAAFRLDS